MRGAHNSNVSAQRKTLRLAENYGMKKYTIISFVLVAFALTVGVYSWTGDVQTSILVGTDLLAALMVLSFAFVQVNLNRHLIELQDYVSVNMHAFEDGKGVQFVNTGKLNVYIYRIEVRDQETDILIGATKVFERPRLLPAGTLEASYYWFPLPKDTHKHKEFKVDLLLTDELEREWVSGHGGEVLSEGELRTWSYKTIRQKWHKQKIENNV